VARDPAAAAGRAVRDLHPSDHRHGAGVPRALPVHRRGSGELDDDDPAAHLQVRLPELPRRRLRRRDRAEPHARRRARPVLARLLPTHEGLEPVMTAADTDRGILSSADWRRRRVRVSARITHGILLASLLVVGLGPILWLAKSAVTPTQDTLRQPLALWP